MGVYQDIKAKIITKLKTLANVKVVYGYEKEKLGGHPAVVVLGTDFEDILEDTRTNLRQYVFKVRFFQEIATTTPERAEEIFDNIVDQLMNLFAQDFTLGGTCEGCWVKSTGGWVDREVGMRVLDMQIIAKKLVTI